MLDKKSILAASDLTVKEVDMPEWGGKVFIRQLSGKERAEFEDETDTLNVSDMQSDQLQAMVIFCAYVICDDKQERLFTSEEAAELAKKSVHAIKHVFNEGMLLNAIRAEDIDDLAKN